MIYGYDHHMALIFIHNNYDIAYTTFFTSLEIHILKTKRNVPLIDLRYVHIVIVRAGHVHSFKLLMNDRLCKT